MTAASQQGAVRAAFLVLDYATYIVENFSHDAAVADRASAALAAARAAGLPVIYVVPAKMEDQIHPAVAPADGEPVLVKTSFGAFATTNLDELLRKEGVGHLIIAGVATSGCVLSTTRWAVDVGYQVTVCADACADPDPAAHAALTDKSVFPHSYLGLWRMAQVLPAAEIPELAPQPSSHTSLPVPACRVSRRPQPGTRPYAGRAAGPRDRAPAFAYQRASIPGS